MQSNKRLTIFTLVLAALLLSLQFTQGERRVFQTSFESVNDFDGFYLTKNGEYASTMSLTTENVYDGKYSCKSMILSARDVNNDSQFGYLPHRAYPTIQLQKTSQGHFQTPTFTTIYVWLNITLQNRGHGHINDWFSFATFTSDPSDAWNRVVVVNIAPDGYVRLVHVPYQSQQNHVFQASPENDPKGELLFPYNQWVRLDIYLDFRATNGTAMVWMNNKLTSHACVRGGFGYLEQAHFGMYSGAAIANGVVYNDKLSITTVDNLNDAMQYFNLTLGNVGDDSNFTNAVCNGGISFGRWIHSSYLMIVIVILFLLK